MIPGTPGAKGDTGAPGISGYELVMRALHTRFRLGGFVVATATCPAGKRVLGGGFTTVGGVINAEGATADGTQWIAQVKNSGAPGVVTAAAQAICGVVVS